MTVFVSLQLLESCNSARRRAWIGRRRDSGTQNPKKSSDGTAFSRPKVEKVPCTTEKRVPFPEASGPYQDLLGLPPPPQKKVLKVTGQGLHGGSGSHLQPARSSWPTVRTELSPAMLPKLN